MIPSLYAAARVHVCAACGRKGKFGTDAFRYATVPAEPYLNADVLLTYCSENCEAKASEMARVA
jgi:hypothetical protein